VKTEIIETNESKNAYWISESVFVIIINFFI
jgi:hypothetical protein